MIAFTAFAFPVVTNKSTNVLYGTDKLVTPGIAGYPNDDTLYSNGIFDLSQNEVVVTIPQVDADRWFSIDFHDV